MSYSNNPLLPKARRQAVKLVLKEGFSITTAAKKSGIHRSTLHRWLVKAQNLHKVTGIHTRSSRPKSCPWQLGKKIVCRVLELRKQHQRCGKVIHALLLRQGTVLSNPQSGRHLNSWYGRPGRLRRPHIPRPAVEAPGDLVEVDTIHLLAKVNSRLQRRYVYTLIDVKTRWAYAFVRDRHIPEDSLEFMREARKRFPHSFKVIQTDNGSEFAPVFERELKKLGVSQRRIRLGKKNDNAHIERFNRTMQDECIGAYPNFNRIRRDIALWLDFYNAERLHLGLQCSTPMEVLLKP